MHPGLCSPMSISAATFCHVPNVCAIRYLSNVCCLYTRELTVITYVTKNHYIMCYLLNMQYIRNYNIIDSDQSKSVT